MPIKAMNEEGEEIEAFTADELEAQKQAAIDEFKASNPDKSAELASAQEELEKLKGKDMNFSNLRAQKEAAEKKVADILAGVDEKIGAAKNEILEGVTKEHYLDTIKKLAGDDKELLDKIEFHYKRLTDPAGSKEAITKKITDAYLLATGTGPKDISSSAFGSGGVNRPNFPTAGGSQLSADEKKMAQELAARGGMTITEEDLKKY